MSAPDLIAEYYRRDLTEAEEEQLAQLLQASPADSARFAALAAEDYKRFGLPEPGQGWRQRKGTLGLALAIAGGAWLGYALLVPQRAQVVTMAEEREALPQAAERAEAPEPAEEPEADQAPAPAAPRPLPTLRVSAESAAGPFLLHVRGGEARALGVSDARGRTVGRLRERGPGLLAWDGRDLAGEPVLPGRYALRVEAQGRELKKWVEIDVR